MEMRHALVFVRENALRIFLVSTLVLVPCFWHKSIEAGDIPSHTYNAWLALLIKQGKAPGLYIESRWNNVLVDWTLEKLGALLGFVVVERIIVVISVLIFFWGAFALISAANRRPPWYLVPALAMITYGWTFYSGFLNFYLSLGLAFFAVVLIWRGNNGDWLLAALLAVLVLMAHPLGFVCLIGLAAYFRLADTLRGWLRWALFASAFLAVLLVHFYTLSLHTEYTHTNDFDVMNGADQLILFQAHYAKLAGAVLVIGIFCFVYGVLREWKSAGDRWAFRTPLELWAVFAIHCSHDPRSALVLSGAHALCSGYFPIDFGHRRLGYLCAGIRQATALASRRLCHPCFHLFRLDSPGHRNAKQDGTASGKYG